MAGKSLVDMAVLLLQFIILVIVIIYVCKKLGLIDQALLQYFGGGWFDSKTKNAYNEFIHHGQAFNFRKMVDEANKNCNDSVFVFSNSKKYQPNLKKRIHGLLYAQQFRHEGHRGTRVPDIYSGEILRGLLKNYVENKENERLGLGKNPKKRLGSCRFNKLIIKFLDSWEP